MTTRMSFSRSLVTAAMIGALGCVDAPEEAPREAVRFAVLLPFVGDRAATGANLERAALMAAESFNDVASIRGLPLSLYLEDPFVAAGGGVSREGVYVPRDVMRSSLDYLVERAQPKLLLGPLTSDLAVFAAASVYDAARRDPRYGMAHFGAAIASEVNVASWCSTNLFPSYRSLGDILGRAMVDDGVKRAGILFFDDDYGQHVEPAIRDGLTAHGGTIAKRVSISPSVGDPLAALASVLAADPDGIMLVAYPKMAAEIIIESVLSHGGRDLKWYLAPALRADTFLNNVPPGLLENATGVAVAAARDTRDFDAAYRVRWSTDVPLIDSYYFYDTVTLGALALYAATREAGGDPPYQLICEKARSLSGGGGTRVAWNELDRAVELIERGEDIDYEGVSGPVELDERGNLVDGFLELWRIEGHEIKTLEVVSLRSPSAE